MNIILPESIRHESPYGSRYDPVNINIRIGDKEYELRVEGSMGGNDTKDEGIYLIWYVKLHEKPYTIIYSVSRDKNETMEEFNKSERFSKIMDNMLANIKYLESLEK
jgi:hypothetical protein